MPEVRGAGTDSFVAAVVDLVEQYVPRPGMRNRRCGPKVRILSSRSPVRFPLLQQGATDRPVQPYHCGIELSMCLHLSGANPLRSTHQRTSDERSRGTVLSRIA